MNPLAALAQSVESSWPPLGVVLLVGAVALLLGLTRLLRRLLRLVTRVLVSAGAAMTGIAVVLALCAALTTVLLVYPR